MNKRKILSLAMALSIVAIMAVGATLAYFTDTDEATNVFTVGSVDIELNETVSMKDKNGAAIEDGITTNDDGSTSFNNVMPSYKMDKTAVVKNTGKSDAYVRVIVRMNNYNKINSAIDGVYEATSDELAQQKYNEVFVGWNMKHGKLQNSVGAYPRRTIAREANDQLLHIDYYMESAANDIAMFDTRNWFQSEIEAQKAKAGDYSLLQSQSYYKDYIGAYENMYVYFLKLEAGKEYKLFDGLTCPAEFTSAQAAMFDGLRIDIDAAAIQCAGFDTAKDAFTELATAVPIV